MLPEYPAPVLPRREFWFLRHGETDWNARQLAQGAADIQLNARGLEQAHAAAELLRGLGIVAIHASPLSRARDTAEIAARVLGLEVNIVPELREAAYGIHEGVPMSGWFHGWVTGENTPQGAESFADLRRRACRAMDYCLAGAAPALIVAHGGLFRALRAEMGLEADLRPPNAVPILCTPTASGWDLRSHRPGAI